MKFSNPLILVCLVALITLASCQASFSMFKGKGQLTNYDTQTLQPNSEGEVNIEEYLQNLFNSFGPLLQYFPLFEDVTMGHPVPAIFIEGQVFRFEGSAKEDKMKQHKRKNPSQNTYIVSVVFFNPETKKKEVSCTEYIEYDNLDFSIQCLVPKIGEYHLSVFVGTDGLVQSHIYEVVDSDSILSEIEDKKIPATPKNVSLLVRNNEFYISWKKSTALTKIKFSQERPRRIEKQFVISNYDDSFRIPYPEFQQFKKAPTKIEISHAQSFSLGAYERISQYSKKYSQTIDITEHRFSDIRDNEIIIYGFLPSDVKVDEKISIRGRIKQPIKSKAIVLDPLQKINEYDITINQASKTFTFTFVPLHEGTYVIEINHIKGYALINVPIYVGQVYPLLPNFDDFTPVLQNPKNTKQSMNDEMKMMSSMSIQQQRMFILKLINEQRKALGVHPVELDPKLNELAQKHSEDMAQNKYSGHKNRKGQTHKERAKALGIRTLIGENIVVDKNIELGQLVLNNSPVHLRNMINLNWEFVGIGIAKGDDELYYMTQDFSSRNIEIDPLSQEEIQEHIDHIVETLSKENKNRFMENKNLSKSLALYGKYNRLNTAFMTIIIQSQRINKHKIVDVTIPTYGRNFVEELKSQGYLTAPSYSKVSVALVPKGNALKVVMIYH